jgi:hypothetical protein
MKIPFPVNTIVIASPALFAGRGDLTLGIEAERLRSCGTGRFLQLQSALLCNDNKGRNDNSPIVIPQ